MEVTLLAWSLAWDWEYLFWILLVAVGLGAVIFVHELGHFLVAKACGVKCEKFFLGFDIGGIKVSQRWGETEYGIGILPFGGYVKMLGQDDNPARIAEEMERARIRQADPTESDPSATDQEPFQLDPRSYLAKSVPQRMAIISAGVVMNVIFAFVFAAVAYGLGVKYFPCVVSQVIPGSPAWQAGLCVGDEIVQIGALKKPRFRDLRSDISLGNPQQKVQLLVRRPGRSDLLSFRLRPQKTHGLPTIGIVSPRSLTLYEKQPCLPGTPASRAQPPLLGGDRIVAVNGQEMTGYHDLVRMLAQHPDQPLKVTVERADRVSGTGIASPTGDQPITSRIPPHPIKRLGVTMGFGPIIAVQDDSPAARAGIQPGDVLLTIDGRPPGDPMTLPERLRRRAAAGQSVRLVVSRTDQRGQNQRLEKTVALRVATWFETADMPGTPVAVPSLGIAYHAVNPVRQVDPAGPAAKVGILAGDTIVQAAFEPAPNDTSPQARQLADTPFPLGEQDRNWAALVQLVQATSPGAAVRLTVRRGEHPPRDVRLEPFEATDLFNPERGLVTGPVEVVRHADSVADALWLAGCETKDSLLMVFRFLQRLIDRQISPRLLGGPVTIAKVAFDSASGGVASLLIFLTVLSANLAVINFLPIPLLDGGHMVLLALEGIMRRPVSEKIIIALHTIGFVLIIGVMLFALALDFGLIPRGL